jgi:hypothetical protein
MAGRRRGRRPGPKVRDFDGTSTVDDARLKELFQEWSRSGWLLQRWTILRGRYSERPQQYTDSVVLIAEREEDEGVGLEQRRAARATGSGDLIVGFVCVGLKQVYLRGASLRVGFVLDLHVRPGTRYTSTGMLLLQAAESRCRWGRHSARAARAAQRLCVWHHPSR